MELDAERGACFSFGRFRLDPVRRTLSHDGVPVKLPARLFDTLAYLVRHAGRLVERNELLTAVWGGRIVEEANLTQTIFAIRKALQAADPSGTYITTLAGRGYQFAAPVELCPQATDAEPAPLGSAPRPARPGVGRLVGALALALVAVAAVLAAWLGSRRDGAGFAPPSQSVAVLAFANLSGDQSLDYLSDGLSEEVISVLGRIPGVRVAARGSAFSLKGQSLTVPEVARRLNVAAVLEGSVRRESSRLRIAAELVDARTGYQLWSESFDRQRGDMVQVQQDIATAVVGALKPALVGDSEGRLTAGATRVPQAFDALLRGRGNAQALDDDHARAALAEYDEAIALDPSYAAAYAARAAVLNWVIDHGSGDDPENSKRLLDRAVGDIDRAIALAPDLPEGHIAKADILLTNLDMAAAERELAEAYRLAPGNAAIETKYGFGEARLGHFEAALRALRHAVTIDPLRASPYRNLANGLFAARQYPEALAEFAHADALDSKPSLLKRSMPANAYYLNGDPAAAARVCDPPEIWEQNECLAMAYHALGRQTEAEAQLQQMWERMGYRAAYNYADIYAQWGRSRDALNWLKVAFDLRDPGLNEMKFDQYLDPLRAEPEFQEMIRRLGFPP